jgi:FAD/FMN-containing dehydrogenase
MTGWGAYPKVTGTEVSSEDLERATRGVNLTRGLARSYGDASLPLAGQTAAASPPANRFLAFDEETGLLRAEAGLSLEEIYRLFLPRNFYVPVTPGTKFVTLGGMVAADVHGKNHHQAGTFGAHVTALKLRLADGRIIECSPTVEPALFRATIGGMGLTGHILEVEFKMERLPSPWIWGESEGVPDIDAFIDALGKAAASWPMTMGWIDCISTGKNLGRGIIYRGRWATAQEAPKKPPRPRGKLSLPLMMPSYTVNNFTTKVFNLLYYWVHKRAKKGIVHPDVFFYPLDAIHHWNRIYGRNGFTQYQCVIPHASGKAATRRFMEVVAREGSASFLCVIKDCGPEGTGMLSFPRPGISIAIDFPVRPGTQKLIDALNEIVLAEGGRIYLAKDAFTRKDHFERMEPRLAEFQGVRKRWDPEGKLGSGLSARLLGGDK